MNEPGLGSLMDQSTFVRRVGRADTPDWVRDHWETFEAGLTGERNGSPFPCFFGAESVRNGDPLYTVCDSMTDPAALRDLGETLLEYLAVWPDHGDRASLVTFFRPPEREWDEREYHEALWNVLQFLHVHDPEPWPASIPTDPDHPEWEFSFGGEPMFPTCRAPFYEDRRSRYCPVGLEITFQPRALFENLNVTADHPTGQQAREIIQSRLGEYDDLPAHPLLGDWGVEGDREWHQYMLPTGDEHPLARPPIRVSRDHPKAEPIRRPAIQ
ncbi:YqcI/YcgG family protein [Halosegnis marinus]|uniref:YqcI/YcgG family protein n=1 Tax=Halosegnis marinus TaxID=3034023 RepID=A0ABD5ZN38_9EURY|nr:YqcI/YcgG family protein [Halosegnis sp. DT85]